MKKKIEIAVSAEKINKTEREIDFPETANFYRRVDDGNFFPEGVILFAIIPSYPGSTSSYTLVRVTRNRQQYNDFVPSKDCKSSYWLTSHGDNTIRKEALGIITKEIGEGWDEITQEDFEKERQELLNKYQEVYKYTK